MEKEEKKYKEIELRSEEVQEVMSLIPAWILRRGITMLFIIVLLLLIGSWFFKYPDVIRAEITVTSLEPPANIITRSAGKIDTIYVTNNQRVVSNSPLAVIQNPANSNDMLLLVQMMREWDTFGYSERNVQKILTGKPMALGTIQSVFASFLTSLNDYQNYKTLNYYPQKTASQRQQLVVQREYYSRIIRQEPVIREQFRTSKNIFDRDSVLLAKNVISGNEYDISKNSFGITNLAGTQS